MVEFRTYQPPEEGQGEASGSDSVIDSALNTAIENIKSDPEAQVQIAQALNENYGIPPQILSAFLGDIPNEANERTEQADVTNGRNKQAEQMKPTNDNMEESNQTRTKEVTKKPDPEELIGFVDEIIDYTDEDMTLGELRAWAKENQDIVDTAIKLKF